MAGTSGVKITEEVQITGDVTFFAHWEKLICYKATALHTDNTNTFGYRPDDESSLRGGWAYDCDVNGNDEIDTLNDTNVNSDSIERFYYLKTDSDGYAALIFWNNTHQNSGTLEYVCGADALVYASSPASGPDGPELPTTSQWTNVSLHSTPRQLYNELGTTAFGDSTLSTASYSGKAARFATTQEIEAVTGLTASAMETANSMINYKFLFENLKVLPTLGNSSCRSNYWLETPKASGSNEWRVSGDTGHYKLGYANGSTSGNKKSGTRPVIEVPTNLIEDFPITYTVTYDNDGVVYDTAVVGMDAALGTLPTAPTKTNYAFAGWYTSTNWSTAVEVTSSRIIHDNVTFYAKWVPAITQATVSPLSINLNEGETETITISGPSDMESYTMVSNDTTVATVDNSTKVVTAQGAGTTTITITGDTSNATVTVNVTVNSAGTVTVRFFDVDGVTEYQDKATTVTSGGSLGINMPSDPTKSNHIFNVWYIKNTATVFTSATTVTGNVDVVANWKEYVTIATITTNPSPLRLLVGEDAQVIVSPTTSGNTVENYTISSSNTNFISVSGNTLSAEDITNGTITITITGTESTLSTTLTAEVVDTYQVVFDNDGVDYDTWDVAIDDPLGSLPTPPTKSNYVFVGWYDDDVEPDANGDIDANRIDENTVIDSNKRYYAVWAADTYQAEMNNKLYTTVQLAVNDAPTNVKTTIRLLKSVTNTTMINLYDTSNSTPAENQSKNIVFDLNGFTVTNNTTYAFRSKAAIEIKNGNIVGSSGSGAIEANTGGTIKLYDVNVTATGTKQAVYNGGGTIEIYGNSTFTAKAKVESSNRRGTIQNNSGTLKIYGGTILTSATGSAEAIALRVDAGTVELYDCEIDGTGANSTGATYGVYVTGGTLKIGEVDTKHDTSRVIIKGKTNGIYTTANINFYDGKILAVSNNAAINDEQKIANTESGFTKVKDTETISSTTYNRLYYVAETPYYRINFAGDGTPTDAYIDYPLNQAITTGDLTTAIRADYTFTGWYTNPECTIAFTTYTPTSAGSTTLYAGWVSNSAYYRINFAGDGTPADAYLDYPLNQAITTNDLTTATRANYTFTGWYTDSGCTIAFTSYTPTTAGSTTLYAGWTFNSSFTPVQHNILSTAMQQYFANVSTWETTDLTDPSNPTEPYLAPQSRSNFDNGHDLLKASIEEVFSNNSCSYCASSNGSSTRADNNCNYPSTGTYCDQPIGYDTGIADDLNVYLYTNNQKGSLVTYTTSTGGVIYNMIPGVTYLWESSTDNTKYGVVTATGTRRTLKTAVRNLRDLGGLSASNSDVTGTIDYGRLYRGAQITTAQGVTDLNKLGITREVDLRGNGDGIQTYKMTNYDTGTSSSYNDIVMTNYIVNPLATPYITDAHMPEYRAVKAAMREVMEKVVFNHDSIFFHCTIGTDRTGTLAYFLEGLLGVSETDRLRDYEMTYFFGLTNRTRFHDTSGWSNTAPRFYSMYRSYPTNADIYNYFTQYEPHEVNPNDENDLTDAELVRRFRLELIH